MMTGYKQQHSPQNLKVPLCALLQVQTEMFSLRQQYDAVLHAGTAQEEHADLSIL